MRVEPVDERCVVEEQVGATWLVFVYEGGSPGFSWSVDSYRIDDASFSEVLSWLDQNLPADCCWALGVTTPRPHPNSHLVDLPDDHVDDVAVQWVVGADLLHSVPSTDAEAEIVEQMLARGSSTVFPLPPAGG